MTRVVQLEVWGPYALFSRPELKVERVSYDVPTPSAARGILDAIYWHHGLKWRIDRIYVLKPMDEREGQGAPSGGTRFISIRRNEVKKKISARNVRQAAQGGGGALSLIASRNIVQRASLVLRDVHYVIEAHFDMTQNANPSDNPGKFQDCIRRRIERGQCYHTPYFGCREFPANFRMWTGGDIPAIDETRDLGLMLYDFDYSDPEHIAPTYFRARLEHGVMDLRNCEVLR